MLSGDQLVAINPPSKTELEHLHSTIELVLHHLRLGYQNFVIEHCAEALCSIPMDPTPSIGEIGSLCWSNPDGPIVFRTIPRICSMTTASGGSAIPN